MKTTARSGGSRQAALPFGLPAGHHGESPPAPSPPGHPARPPGAPRHQAPGRPCATPRGLARRARASLVARLRADGERIAHSFGLRYRAIEAESARVRRRYGSCHSDGVIKIRLTHAVTGRPLKYSSLIDTLCHELAHLKHFHHGPIFRDFYLCILDWARREGIYRPEPRRAAPPPAAALSRAATPARGTLAPVVAGGGTPQLALFSDARRSERAAGDRAAGPATSGP